MKLKDSKRKEKETGRKKVRERKATGEILRLGGRSGKEEGE